MDLSVHDQIVPLHGFALNTLLNVKIGGMRVSAREAEAKTAPSSYVDPKKEKGELTQKQQETNQDRLRVSEMVKQNSKISSKELMPPPPTGSEMTALNKFFTHVGANLYEDNPVKVVPYSSEVLQAYKNFQSGGKINTEAATGDNVLYPPVTELPPLYKLYA